MTTWNEITVVFGEVTSRRRRQASEIAPDAIDHFAALIRENPKGWRKPLAEGLALDLHVTIERPGGAVATFSDRKGPLVTSAYLTGKAPEADREIVDSVQRDIVYGIHRAFGIEAGFDLAKESVRPLVAAIIIPRPDASPRDLAIIGDAESCLAAALFGEGEPES